MAEKEKVKKFDLFIPIYEQLVKIYLTPDVQHTLTEIEKEYGVYIDKEGVLGYTSQLTNKKETDFIIALPLKLDNSILVHECIHLTNYILDYVGIKFDFNNDEVQAYTATFLFEQISNMYLNVKEDGRRKTKSNTKLK